MMFDDTREIYKRFVDSESRHIFLNRFLYSALGDLQYIKNMIQGTGWWRQLSSILQNLHDRVFIFGAGGCGRDFLIWLDHCEGFIDNNEAIQGKYLDGKKVYSLKEVIYEYGNKPYMIVIANYLHHAEIKQQCVQLRGAEQVIRRDRPKLAISVYHRMEDIVKIPALLLDFQPNYTFYLRHYSLSSGETVLYAI